AAASGYGDLVALEHRLSRQAARLAELGDRVTAADLERFGRDQEQFAHAGGYGLEARVDAVLQGLGFDPADARTRPLASLSGGERSRVGLAAFPAAQRDEGPRPRVGWEIGRAHVELQSRSDLVCRLLLEKKKKKKR